MLGKDRENEWVAGMRESMVMCIGSIFGYTRSSKYGFELSAKAMDLAAMSMGMTVKFIESLFSDSGMNWKMSKKVFVKEAVIEIIRILYNSVNREG